jgi:hypothetical protein
VSTNQTSRVAQPAAGDQAGYFVRPHEPPVVSCSARLSLLDGNTAGSVFAAPEMAARLVVCEVVAGGESVGASDHLPVRTAFQ